MAIKINNYDLMQQHITEIDSTKDIILLPNLYNYAGSEGNKMIFDKHSLNIVKKFKEKQLSASLLSEDPLKIAYRYNRSIDWVGPVFLITSQIINNPDTFDTVLEIIKLYLGEICKDSSDKSIEDCKFVYRENNEFKEVSYTGPVSGLSEVKQIIKELDK